MRANERLIIAMPGSLMDGLEKVLQKDKIAGRDPVTLSVVVIQLLRQLLNIPPREGEPF